VTYYGGLQIQPIIFDQVIDLSMFEGIGHLEEQESKDTQALKSLADSLRRAQRNLEELSETVIAGVPLRVPELLGALPDATVETWKRRLFAKLNEFRMLWITVYAGDFDRRVRLYTENLQSRSSIIASQLLLIASTAPGGVSQELVESLAEISAKLAKLSERQFYVDGGESYKTFNNMGDEIITLMDDVAEKAQALRSTAPENEQNSELDV
jgi:methyl-accepting chemotaxis protein